MIARVSDFRAFPGDYAEARRRFLDTCRRAGSNVVTYSNPGRGPRHEDLATDVACFGSDDSEAVLVVLSATHGVEGFCGSALQVAWVEGGGPERLPAGTAVFLVHAVNPWGFAWLRRVTEEGVDLNRNFVDFSKPLPINPDYEVLANALLPPDLSPITLAAADARLSAYAEAQGERAFEEAVSGGQFSHPAGLFYGGTGPTWSRLTIEHFIRTYHLAKRKRVAVIDVHTGLGPYGYGEIICDHPAGSVGARLAHAWYGAAVTEPALGTSTSVPKAGLSDYGWQRMLGDALVFVALEFGTYDVADMFRVLRADHWLHGHGLPDWEAPETQRVKTAIRNHFFPDEDDWKRMVLSCGARVIDQALAGLARSR